MQDIKKEMLRTSFSIDSNKDLCNCLEVTVLSLQLTVKLNTKIAKLHTQSG